ncbi:MAG TPA: protein translocase subunit SecD [Candidatus Saccharimonadales bacterium]|nr:protein translocase subunit SecD [Candidatus Saccharimonadales bacterium]
MQKSPRKILFFIILLTIAALYIDLPRLAFKNYYFVHPQYLKQFLKRDLEPKLGLDLAGGVQLTMSADMSQVPEGDRDTALESAQNIIENRINSLGVAEPVIQSAKTQGQYRLIVEIAGISNVDQAVSIVKKTAQLEFKTLKADAPPESTIAALPEYYQSTGLTGKDLKRAQAQPSQNPQNPGYVVSLEFNDEGAKKFADITKNNLGKPVAIYLDDQLISAPIVNAEIADGRAQIEGHFTADGSKQLAVELNAGALPVPLKIESQTRVGPTLGSDSIHKSIYAAAIGLAAVSIFMIAYYNVLGIFAVTALAIYTLISFAVFKLVPVTLTLAGIAGFVLSIGMAVDANILIFERIKEELRWGKPKHEALYAGFNRAWSSIKDSNISSLITTAILFNFGTGSIRGFALTLAIGILVSMFSAITVSRTLLRIFWVRKI